MDKEHTYGTYFTWSEVGDSNFCRLADVRKQVSSGTRAVGDRIFMYHNGLDRPSWPNGFYRATVLLT